MSLPAKNLTATTVNTVFHEALDDVHVKVQHLTEQLLATAVRPFLNYTH